jgi:hypothetical protein
MPRASWGAKIVLWTAFFASWQAMTLYSRQLAMTRHTDALRRLSGIKASKLSWTSECGENKLLLRSRSLTMSALPICRRLYSWWQTNSHIGLLNNQKTSTLFPRYTVTAWQAYNKLRAKTHVKIQLYSPTTYANIGCHSPCQVLPAPLDVSARPVVCQNLDSLGDSFCNHF